MDDDDDDRDDDDDDDNGEWRSKNFFLARVRFGIHPVAILDRIEGRWLLRILITCSCVISTYDQSASAAFTLTIC